METILLAVTAVSLLVALIMSAAAWRLSREERARAAARVAALASAASFAHDVPAEPSIATPKPAPAPPAPVVDELPLRPVLRVVDTDVARVPEVLRVLEVPKVTEVPRVHEAPVSAGFLNGGEAPLESAGRQRGLMAAAAVLLVVLGTGAYWLLSGNALAENSVSASAPAASAPLELISLRHERRGSKLELSGLVRNPSAGASVEGLNAVVFLFDAHGGFISSGRVGVDFKRLAPGDESPFVITMDAPSHVARYRVSFRTDAGVVAHVDRRSEQPVATAIVR
jgi:hypothetical protein